MLRAFLRDTAVEGLRAEPSVRELIPPAGTRARGPQQGLVKAVGRKGNSAGRTERERACAGRGPCDRRSGPHAESEHQAE